VWGEDARAVRARVAAVLDGDPEYRALSPDDGPDLDACAAAFPSLDAAAVRRTPGLVAKADASVLSDLPALLRAAAAATRA
jgi:hypothetical protein